MSPDYAFLKCAAPPATRSALFDLMFIFSVQTLESQHNGLMSEKEDLLKCQQLWRRRLASVTIGEYRDRRRDESSPVSSITDSTSSEQGYWLLPYETMNRVLEALFVQHPR